MLLFDNLCIPQVTSSSSILRLLSDSNERAMAEGIKHRVCSAKSFT